MNTNPKVTEAALRYTQTKAYMSQGQKFEIEIEISLDDDCGNKRFDFHATSTTYWINERGQREWVRCGCCHDEILKHFPEMRLFVEMHLRDREGMPMHPFANGFYWLTHGKPEYVIKDWWLTEEDGDKKTQLLEAPDQDYFTYMLYEYGFVDRAKAKAEQAIRALEELTGKKWINPYTPEEERIYHRPEELIKTVKDRISNLYYAKEAIEQRDREAKKEEYDKIRARITNDAHDEMEKIRVKRDVYLFVLDAGLPIDNMIYYTHAKRAVFNWHEPSSLYPSQVTWEDLDKLMAFSNKQYHIPAYTVFTLNEAYEKKLDRGVVIMGYGAESCWVGEPLPYPHNSHNPWRQIHKLPKK